ncbi:MAG: class I SAM-dependent methyltransferase [Gammaproteobacteria bacterium]|nr:class I SAM-dependent methyltransferase [Gammaproteobacteria bacterium]
MATDALSSECVIYGDVSDTKSISLAKALNVKLESDEKTPDRWHLVITSGRLELVGEGGVRLTLSESEIERRLKGFVRSGLARACGVSRMPRVLDALSGWGTDGVTMAAFGCRVVCCEVIPMVATLNRARALNIAPETHYIYGDAVEFMRLGSHEFDVIYLDDMFPPHPKRARPSKSLQILSELAADCDIGGVLDTALEVSKDRVVVKRRRNQSPERNDPAWSIEGKTVRFDVYRTSSI